MKLNGKYLPLLKKLSFLQKKWVLFGIVIVTASLWRLTNLMLIEFKGDEALNLFLATRPLFGHPFPPSSLASSVGILNFPILNYFLFPIVLISFYPPFVSFCIGLLNVLAIGAYFLMLSKYTNRLTAFITTILFSLAPWAILYGRKIWAQDFLIPLVVALLFCFFKIYTEKKQIYWLFFGIVSLFLIQIHQTAGILPVLLFLPLVKKGRVNLKFLIAGIAIGSLATLPYVFYEIVNKCPDCVTFSLLHSKLQTYQPSLFIRIFQITTTGNFHTILGDTDNLLLTNLYPITAKLTRLSYLIYLLLPLSMLFFWRLYKEYRFFVISIFLVLFVFFILKIQPEMHYVIILLPFLFLFLGSFFAYLLTQKHILLKTAGILLLTLFILIYAGFDYSFYHLLSIRKGFGGDYGTAYSTTEASAKKALQSFQNRPDYKEIVLAYYVPKDQIKGDSPVGRILYPFDQIQKKLVQLNAQLQKSPTDPRAFNQLLAFYTYPQNQTYTNFSYLKKQSVLFPVYTGIYQTALGDYITIRHKHYFIGNTFWLFYPEHWHEAHTSNFVVLSDENVSFTLYLSPQTVPQNGKQTWTAITRMSHNQPVNELVCSQNNMWCGTFIPTFSFNGQVLSVSMSSLGKTIDRTVIESEQKVMDDILDGMISAI